MTDIIKSRYEHIQGQVHHLRENDPVFAQFLPKDLVVDRVIGEPTMASLIRIVIGQQISNKVAQTLWKKLTDEIDPSDPDQILTASDDQLKSYGLSRQKIAYVQNLALHVKEQIIDISSWLTKDSDIVAKEITSLKGFGPWSAQIFLMFHLCDPHIWPAGDLGIQIGLQQYFDLENRPNEKETEKMKSHFDGYETAASFLLWALKGDDIRL